MAHDAHLAKTPWDGLAPARRNRHRPARPVKIRQFPAQPSAESPAVDLATFAESRLSGPVFAGLVRAAEFALLAGLGLWIARGYVTEFHNQYLTTLIFMGLAAVLLFQGLGLYSVAALSNVHRQMPRLLMGWTASVGLLTAAVFFLKVSPYFSRVWLGLWYFGGIALLVGFRTGIAALTRRGLRSGLLARRALVYGTGPGCETVLKTLEDDPDNDIQVCGVFDERGGNRSQASVAGYRNLGNIDAVLDTCRKLRIDMLIVALPLSAETRVLQILRKLWVLPVDIRLAANASKLRFRPHTYSYAGRVPLLDILDKPIADWDVVVKAAFDRIVGTLAVIALAPVMALVALAIKLDSPGPVLFRQKRYGFNNELIEIFKFRSMYVGGCDAAASRLVTRDDPRVTRVGRFIRKASLDELPQLFNVLRGELSLVGPRPHALQAKAADQLYHDVVDGYFARHKVKPGITGWAQIHGWRGETDTEEKIQKRVEHDLYYIDNWSLLLDVYILAATPFALIKTDNAY